MTTPAKPKQGPTKIDKIKAGFSQIDKRKQKRWIWHTRFFEGTLHISTSGTYPSAYFTTTADQYIGFANAGFNTGQYSVKLTEFRVIGEGAANHKLNMSMYKNTTEIATFNKSIATAGTFDYNVNPVVTFDYDDQFYFKVASVASFRNGLIELRGEAVEF